MVLVSLHQQNITIETQRSDRLHEINKNFNPTKIISHTVFKFVWEMSGWSFDTLKAKPPGNC